MAINKNLRHSLEAYKAVRPAVQDDHLLISQVTQEGLTTSAIQSQFRNWGRIADIPHCSPHRLRHSGATAMDKAGIRHSVIQRALGHASAATTSRYLRADDDEVEQGMAALEDW